MLLRQKGVLFFALIVLLCVVFLHTILFYFFESGVYYQKNKVALTLFDSLWVTLTTLTTVGYGDISASTVGGRLTTIILGYAAGLTLFASLAGEVLTTIFERVEKRRRGMAKLKLKDHCLIVNFPDKERVRLLIEQLRTRDRSEWRDLVIVADNIEQLPFEFDFVHFVRGDTTMMETYQRACVDSANYAIVLANDPQDPRADALTAAAVSTIEICNSDIQTVAECVYKHHMPLFQHVRCDQIVFTGQMSVKLLVQEFRDSGTSKAIFRLMDRSMGNEFYSTRIGEKLTGLTFRQVLQGFAQTELDVLPIGLLRDNEPMINPARDTILEASDRLMFLSENRPHWSDVEAAFPALK